MTVQDINAVIEAGYSGKLFITLFTCFDTNLRDSNQTVDLEYKRMVFYDDLDSVDHPSIVMATDPQRAKEYVSFMKRFIGSRKEHELKRFANNTGNDKLGKAYFDRIIAFQLGGYIDVDGEKKTFVVGPKVYVMGESYNVQQLEELVQNIQDYTQNPVDKNQGQTVNAMMYHKYINPDSVDAITHVLAQMKQDDVCIHLGVKTFVIQGPNDIFSPDEEISELWFTKSIPEPILERYLVPQPCDERNSKFRILMNYVGKKIAACF